MTKALASAVILLLGQAPQQQSPAPWSADYWAPACCKICNKGKACGDSCIKKTYQCHKGPGCACNGY